MLLSIRGWEFWVENLSINIRHMSGLEKNVKYILKVLITAAIAMAITYGLSRYFEKEFKILLEYVAIIFLVIGGYFYRR